MNELLKCLLVALVPCVICYPVSQPLYQNAQYVSAQVVPQITYKQPAAQGYIQQPQYVRPVPAINPVYESRGREGLQNYATQGQVQAPIQQVLLNTNIDRQVQKSGQITTPIYLQQVQSSQLAAQAQEAFASAQRKASSQAINRQIQPVPVAQQTQVPVQPQQYYREQPQVRYISRPVTAQYRVQQPQRQEAHAEKEQDDYDPNPSYQFGFDVKDDLYTNYQNRKEQRDGNKITGSYSVVDSDGFIRTVSYTADPKEGFKAEVTREPTDIVVKVPKPDPQFQQNIQRPPQYSHRQQPQQYLQQAPVQRGQEQKQQNNVLYQYQ